MRASLFTNEVHHAVNAISFLRQSMLQDLGNHTCAAIAECIGAPPLFLTRTLHNLAKNGIIIAKKGAGGGFRVTQELLDTKTVLDVVTLLSLEKGIPLGGTAGGRLNLTVYDAINITLEDFLL